MITATFKSDEICKQMKFGSFIEAVVFGHNLADIFGTFDLQESTKVLVIDYADGVRFSINKQTSEDVDLTLSPE